MARRRSEAAGRCGLHEAQHAADAAVPRHGDPKPWVWTDYSMARLVVGPGLPTMTCFAVAQEIARDRSSVADAVAHRCRHCPGGILCARPVASDCRGPIARRRA